MGLFGRIAIQEGFITAKQFEVAEVKQRLMRAEGVQKRIGAILVDEGTLTHEQVRRVLDLQKKSVMKCPGCGALFNIENRALGDRIRGKRCRSILQVPSPDENVDQVEEAAPEKVDELADRSARKDTASRLLGREMGGCRVEKLLGKGNMGAVYLGRQVSLDRPVALKVLRQEVLNNPEHVARFEQEARSAARLAHPNIVQVFNMGRDPSGQYFIIMEYVDGQSLGELVKGGGRLEEREALEWILGAAGGLPRPTGKASCTGT